MSQIESIVRQMGTALTCAACLLTAPQTGTAGASNDRSDNHAWDTSDDGGHRANHRGKRPHPPAPPRECKASTTDTPMFVTRECIDPKYNQPYIDVDEQRQTPAPHRYVHGGFAGTDARFAFYFPAEEQYRGRFIQGPIHPLTNIENLADAQVAFVLASGGYAVQTNQGGSEAATFTEAVLFLGYDPEIVGYRVNAAAAKYSLELADQMYGRHRTYGYLFGGSGGAYQTISSAENTTVWDGYVPFVLGSPASIPNGYTLRINAQRILGSAGKFPCILDAIDPGGSGDPIESCDLSEEQAGAYEEATRLGFPPRAWFGASLAGAGALPLVAGYVPFLDPQYTEDFWSMPGYLGHDDPYGTLAPMRIVHNTTVVEKLTNPNRLRLASFPAGDRTAIDLRILSGAGIGAVQLGLLPGYVRAPATNAADLTVTLSTFATPIFNAVQVGDQVALDNSHFLALQTYHRHQVGTREWDFYPWLQLFTDRRGRPIYPQRDVLTGPVGMHNGSGGYMTGLFHGKMMIQESLMDPDAHPWGADWYVRQVERALCEKNSKHDRHDRDGCKSRGQDRHVADKMDNSLRVYMQDHAQHGGGGGTSTRTVSYTGALQQDLRDLAAWVERGVRPPASTSFTLDGGQVLVPRTAAARKGMQPVISLKANYSVRAEVAVGEPVTLTGLIQVPPGTGKVVSVEWNVEGATAAGAFQSASFGAARSSVSVETTHVFTQPGTYFPVLRATSQRQGDATTPFARIDNIGRARVVVR